LAEPPPHDGIAAGTLDNEASRKLVLAFKHERRIAQMLAQVVAARLRPAGRRLAGGCGGAGSTSRRCSLARSALSGATLVVDGLVRCKPRPVLGGLGRKARARALFGAIATNPSRIERPEGSRVVSVEDVITSGATTGACVFALKRAGAQKAIVACFARVLDETLDHAG
jgi:hypothetical protein